MRKSWGLGGWLLLLGCTSAPSGEPAASSSASSALRAPLTSTELCHALLLAPLDRKLASCKTADQGPELEAQKEAIAKAHAQCLEELGRPLDEGRLTIDDDKARRCIQAIERAGDAWIGPHASVLNLAPINDCRAMFTPKQATGDVCTTALECPSQLTCAAGNEGTIGRCATQGSPECSPLALSFGIARRNECQGATSCNPAPRRPSGLDSIGSSPRKPASNAIVRMGKVTISGGLPVEVVQRIVRQNFGRFRNCYEAALRNKRDLVGEVRVAFMIGMNGEVRSVSTKGTTLDDAAAVSCVAKSFYGLSFPNPEKQVPSVVYNVGFGSASALAKPSVPDTYQPGAVAQESWPWGSSGRCEAGPVTQVGCSFHVDCAVDAYCSTGASREEPNRCVARKAAGSHCTQSSECKGRCLNDQCVTSCGSG